MKRRFVPISRRQYPVVRPKKNLNQDHVDTLPKKSEPDYGQAVEGLQSDNYQTAPGWSGPGDYQAGSEELHAQAGAEHYMPGYNPGGDGMMPMHPLAEAHVRWQCFGRTYGPEEALQKGTIFPELYRPYPG